jgi:hypothetical protein
VQPCWRLGLLAGDGGDVYKNTTAAKAMYARLDEFLSDIRDPKSKLPRPNVIGHDFVSEVSCGKIAKIKAVEMRVYRARRLLLKKMSKMGF